MTDPGRIFELGSSDERALLTAARSLRANSASRQRALVSLGVVSALTLAPATAVAALSWLKQVGVAGLGVIGSKWGAGVVITTVAAGAVTMQVMKVAPQREAVVAASASARVASAASEEKQSLSAPAAVTATEPPAAEVIAEDAMPLPAPPPAKLRGVVVPTEIELLDTARQRLRAGDGAAALTALNEHRRSYAKGSLATEARVLRIEALGSAGKREQAVREARQFLRQNPNGLLSHRVRRWLDSQEAR